MVNVSDLKEARRLAGLSQDALEIAAGLNPGIVTAIESRKNKNPSHEIVTKIVRAFQAHGLVGLTADDLFPVTIETAVQRPSARRPKGRAA